MKPSTPTAAMLTAGAYLLAMAGLLTIIGFYLLGTTGLLIALAIDAIMVAAGLPRGSAAANMLHLGAIPLDARRVPWLYGQLIDWPDGPAYRLRPRSC